MSSKEDENPEPPAGDATVISPKVDRDLAEATKGTGKCSLEDGVLVMPSEDIILEAEREIMEALIEEGLLPSSKKDDVEKGANVATREDGVSAPTTEKGADTSSQKDRIAAPPVEGNIDPASQEVNISASPAEGDANTSSQEANVPVSPTEGNTNTSFKEVNISAPSTEGNINPPSQEDGITMPPAENDADMPPQGDDDNITPENQLGSFQHPFMDIGMKMQKYNDALGEFQQLGISHVAVLPELVLVGDQSSGKSTLMSALARLNLPASSGVSTRCPLHIRMSSSSHWSCTISLQLQYAYKPSQEPIIVTANNPFPPWVPQPVKTVVFKTLYESDTIGIGEILRWAQVAILNPSYSSKVFVPGEGGYAMQVDLGAADSVTETKFSPNVISLEMKGPCFPNTSFVDLPGIFAISDNREDDYLVEIIENLTRKYVRREEAIIMLALPMDQDVDNSRALKIIRELHAESRTIGVLTKADKPNFNSADTIAYWLAVLGEKKQKVKRHGFYVTALPPDKDGDSLEAWERDFFVDDVGSWPHAFDDYVHRCGVDQLRFHITTELEVAVAKSIPKIKEKILNRLAETQRHLDEMPDLPQNVEHEVRTNLKDLYVSVKHAFDCQDFEKEYKGLTEWFYRHLLELKPKCSVISRAANARPEGIVIIDSDDGNDHPPSQKRSAPRTPALGSTPKRQRRVEFVPNQEDDFTRLGNFSSPATQAAAAAQRSGAKKFKLSLQELQSEIRHRTRGGFSDIVPLELHEDLCLRAVSQWEKPLQKFMSEVTKMLSAKLTGALESSLKLLSKRRIYKDAKELFDEFLQEGSAHQLAKLKELYGSELYRVVTINEDALNHFKAKEKQDIERARLYTRAHEAGLHGDDRSCKPYGDMSHEEKLEEARLHAKWQAQLPKDHFQREIEVAAKVRAYYLTAATRFVDNVSMDVNASLFRSFREQALNEYMDTKLGLSSNPAAATYERLMGEDHATALRRRELKKERSKLMTAMNRIIDLDNSFTHMA